VLIAGLGDELAADYIAHLAQLGWSEKKAPDAGPGLRSLHAPRTTHHAPPRSLVLFLGPHLSAEERASLDAIASSARQQRPDLVCIVSSFRVHFDDSGATETEKHVLSLFAGLPTVVFRPGHVLSPGSAAMHSLRRFGFCWPLVPNRMHSCFVHGEELFAAIDAERAAPRPGQTYALLGPNWRWRKVLARHRARGLAQFLLTFFCGLLSVLLLGQVAGLIFSLLARRRPALRAMNFTTLRPRSLRELLALYTKYNYHHVKVVGYNNGVVHFGQRFPGRTIVSTVRCNRLTRAGAELLKADCGATIRQARDFLAASNQELYVIPNFSYVSLGTAFFIPIHGSASDFSTVADTIIKVVLYDPVEDRIIVATRDEPDFRERVYDMKSRVVLLRLYLRIKPKGRYYVQSEELDSPDSQLLLRAFQDEQASNVEVRKSQAIGRKVTLYRYYQGPPQTGAPVLELPRDTLGRLWDRLEENPITRFLMHALTRHFAWHVELFFTADEFTTFWATHRLLPLRKIQLRYIRRDGLPKSPFRDHDCVSSDMFMFRRHRRQFEAYLKRTFAVVRANPGKHSG
jgi:hypothetical protein